MDFWEVLISTIAGFIVAFFAEPVKMYLTNRYEKAQLKTSLYGEMLQIYSRLNWLIQAIEDGKVRIDQIQGNLEAVVQSDCYNYAKSKPVLFYQLKEAASINVIYGNFILPTSDKLKTDAERFQYTKAAIGALEGLIEEGMIEKRSLLKVSSPSSRELLKRLTGRKS